MTEDARTESEQVLPRLRQSARQAAQHSYSPYSGFAVGAAVIGADGAVYAGCNVENASFGLTQCAERAALTAAIAAGARPGSLQALVIYTPGTVVHPPCGACRQVMRELMAPDSTVTSCCDSGETMSWSHTEHLPDPFLPEAVGRAKGNTS